MTVGARVDVLQCNKHRTEPISAVTYTFMAEEFAKEVWERKTLFLSEGTVYVVCDNFRVVWGWQPAFRRNKLLHLQGWRQHISPAHVTTCQTVPCSKPENHSVYA
jgi:hypothetical protein